METDRLVLRFNICRAHRAMMNTLKAARCPAGDPRLEVQSNQVTQKP